MADSLLAIVPSGAQQALSIFKDQAVAGKRTGSVTGTLVGIKIITHGASTINLQEVIILADLADIVLEACEAILGALKGRAVGHPRC